MPAHTVSTNHKIGKAIGMLNEAAQEKKDEIRQNFTHLTKRAQKAMSESGKKLKVSATQVDKKVKTNPWAYIGGAAAGALALGFLLGKIQRKF